MASVTRASFFDTSVFHDESLTSVPIRLTTPMAQTEVGRRQVTPSPSSASRSSRKVADRDPRHHPYHSATPRRFRSVSSVPNSDAQLKHEQTHEVEIKCLIPKPPGEVGRPNRGGYNFDIALAWPAKDITALKVWVTATLDLELC